MSTPNTTEYIIWGIPKGKELEEVLLTTSSSLKRAQEDCKMIENRFGATKTRVQILDLAIAPDFIGAILS